MDPPNHHLNRTIWPFPAFHSSLFFFFGLTFPAVTDIQEGIVVQVKIRAWPLTRAPETAVSISLNDQEMHVYVIITCKH